MERTKRMFYFAVGDVIAKRDPLGLFSQSDYMDTEDLYEAYEEKISRITEEICRDEGWKNPHWSKILQAMETAFGSELDRDGGGRLPPALQKEMIETAREIQAAIFQSPAYRPELLQCSEAEKEECLKTVVSLYRLWDLVQQQETCLALFVPNAPFLNALFDGPKIGIDGVLHVKKIFCQCMAAEGFVGGSFLNNAVAAEGVLLYLRFPGKSFWMSRAQWGQKLCDAVKGLFGPDFESRVEACIEREAKTHISLDEEIPFVPLSMDWPKTEDRKVQQEKEEALKIAAKIFRMDFETEYGDVKWEDAAWDFGEYDEDSLKGRIIAEGLARLRKNPTDPILGCAMDAELCCAIKSMLGLEYVKQVDQIFKEEKEAWRERKRREMPSFVPEFDALAKLSPDTCARLLAEIPENTGQKEGVLMEQMFYFAVGDVVAKRDPLGLFPQPDYVYAEELYDAYGEQISQLTEKICRDDGWKDIHWTKILQALKEVFGTGGGQAPPAPQKEMEATAQEIQAAIFQSPAYRPELLQCGEAEKEECLKTVVSLYRLRDLIRRHGYLDLFVPNAPLLDACFDFPEYDVDGIWRIKKIFRQCMATEGFSGGRFLNNAVAAEGILLYLRFPEEACSRRRAQWGQKLCGAVKGLFGPEFESRVEACIERETKEHEDGFLQDEDIPFAPFSIERPKTGAESGKVKEEKEEALKIAAKIFRMDLEAADGDVKWEDASLDFGEYGEDSLKGRIIAEGLACLRHPGDIERFFCTAVKSMLGLEYVKRVDQTFKEERKAYRKRRNKKEPSIVPEFDDLAKLSPEECALVLAKIPENTLVYAFKGAGDKAEDLLWRSLPEKTRQEVEEDLDIVVNVRLKDVEEAQRAILEKARQMFGEKYLSDCGEDENV